jgi:pimeloyl-ACP methyl ester carboxylesterase
MDTRAIYQPKNASRSDFVTIRGLKYHCRIWGREGAPRLFLIHGARDISASWQFTVDSLKSDWHIIAPDWRGGGQSEWGKSDHYTFMDLVGDLHHILRHYSPDAPASIIAHSKGGNVTGMYAGLKPERVAKFVNIEGFVVGSLDPAHAVKRHARWLDSLGVPVRERRYPDYAAFAAVMLKNNPRLSADRAMFLAHEWCEPLPEGIVRQRYDRLQRFGSYFSLPDGIECWKRITAPVLWVEGGQSEEYHRMFKQKDYEIRKAAFKHLRGVEHFAESGHNVHLDEPERLAEVSERFLLQR